jgi:FKBP-type peptidyl-prolyl cis-trans isomerase
MKARHWITILALGFASSNLLDAAPSKREAREQEQAYLAANAEREGVSKTQSGLQYEILEEGATSTEKVRGKHTIELHYHGTLWDGTVFDSSIERGQPITVRLWDVITGWSEGLKLMSPGDKYRFYIPSRLAYGSEGTKTVPPYSPLIFDIKVLSLSQKKR